MERTIDIVLSHPPGPARDHAAQDLVAEINQDPTNPINPQAIGAAIAAARNAIDGIHDQNPRPSQRLIELVEARRAAGNLQQQWH